MAPHAKSELIRYTAACVFAVCVLLYMLIPSQRERLRNPSQLV